MLSAALRPLLVLTAVLGALFAHAADSSHVDVARGQVAPTASPQDGSGSDEDSGWLGYAVLGESAPVSLASTEEPGREPSSTGEGLARLPKPNRTEQALDPQCRGAFTPGERPAALAFLRMNGSANAGGAGT